MGLKMRLYEEDREVCAINWLRNPFGLARWIEDNITRTGSDVELPTLITICGQWTYNSSHQVDRDLFLKVVLSYNVEQLKPEQAYYYFNLPEYRQFIEPVNQE
jgi:hypothetical protein